MLLKCFEQNVTTSLFLNASFKTKRKQTNNLGRGFFEFNQNSNSNPNPQNFELITSEFFWLQWQLKSWSEVRVDDCKETSLKNSWISKKSKDQKSKAKKESGHRYWKESTDESLSDWRFQVICKQFIIKSGKPCKLFWFRTKVWKSLENRFCEVVHWLNLQHFIFSSRRLRRNF